ncbi:hypothetical protein DCC79_00935 [bacterium]|nr:MAG: hypothetical protein DCC79_00935 [bacterium]
MTALHWPRGDHWLRHGPGRPRSVRRARLVAAVAAAMLGAGVALGGLAWSAAGPASAGGLVGSGRSAAVIDPDVRAALLAEPARPISVMLMLDAAAAAPRVADRARMDRQAYRGARVAAWRQGLAVAAAPLRDAIARERLAGRITRADDLWLADALVVTASPGAVWALAGHPAVRRIAREPVLTVAPRADGAGRLGATVPAHQAAGGAAAAIGREREAPSAAALPTGVPAPLWNIRAIQANAVWQRLRIDGTGVTIAVVDTGVDYFHPELQTRYRGHVDGAMPVNDDNWWCTRDDVFCGVGARYPVDGFGHGTHVAGTIVAGDGIGVAPGARWIAARACAGRNCPAGWIIGSVQWLLSLKHDRQPDVVNVSLGTDNPIEAGLFLPVFNRLHALGIVVVAASGNHAGILQAPASFTSTIGVGASTDAGVVWQDSARGVSAWREPKPDLVAPGTGITSTVPGGGRLRNTGTSMATPHVSGVVALLLQARPDLSPADVKRILTRTATPLSPTRPDPAAGWGLVNAYAAVVSVSDVGTVRGTVTREADGKAIPWARVVVADEVGNPLSEVIVDATDGRYAVDLEPGRYLIIARAFAFRSQTQRITVQARHETELDFRLALDEPMGVFRGRLVDAQTGAPLPGELQLDGVPFDIDSDETLGFSQNLPPQTYAVRIEKFGYRRKTDVVKILAGETLSVVYRLDPAPKILLVDGDAWAYNGAIDFYRASLDRLGYVYDEHRVTNDRAGPGQPGGPPLAGTMGRYDVVIWSNALSSPNSVMGAWEIATYLEQGGRLLLSGQDAACYDAGRDVGEQPCAPNAQPHPYVRQKLGLRVVRDRAASLDVEGLPGGPLDGITLTLNGPGSMANQLAPDVFDVTDPLHGRLIATYGDGSGAVVLTGTCVPFRAVVAGFGLEGVTGAAARDRFLQRAIDVLTAAPAEHGVHVAPERAALTRPPGATADYTLTLHNIGALPAAVSMAARGHRWPTELWEAGLTRPLSGTLTLAPCTPRPVVVRVRVPDGTPRGSVDTAHVEVAEAGGAFSRTVAVRTRTPAPVLVVDGDYNRNSEARYLSALDQNGVAYDVWELGFFTVNPKLPTTATLRSYPAVIWFTGYDILRPGGSLGIDGQRRLADYLQAGGRLLLSAEDFLRLWGRTPYRDDRLFHRDFLGVSDFLDDGGAAAAGPMQGVEGSVLAGLEGCRLPPLDPDDDFSDRLVPRPDRLSAPALVDIYGQPVATQHEAAGGFKSLFLAFDAGGLDSSCATALVGRTLDWFSPLHPSTLEIVDAAGQPEIRRAFAGSEVLRLRLKFANSGPRSIDDARVQWHLPVGGEPNPAGLPPGWRWDAMSRVLGWSGRLGPFQSVVVVVPFALDREPGDGATMAAEARLTGEGITVARQVAWRVNASDLGASSKSVPDDQRVRDHGTAVKFVVNVVNLGTRPARAFVVTDTLPAGLTLVPSSLTPEVGDATVDALGRIIWHGVELTPGRTASLSYFARVTTWVGGDLVNRAVLTDDAGGRWDLTARIFARPRLVFPWLGWQRDLDP